MNPAWSVIVFTTVAGAAQGLVVTLALAVLYGLPMSPGFVDAALCCALAMLLVGLGSSFLHLGRPLRAWRSAAMWRTSWLSREVIALPAFIAVVAIWGLSPRLGHRLDGPWLPSIAIALAVLLWYCTAMIYACIRFIQEWAHWLTIVNYAALGLASGMLLATTLAALSDEVTLARRLVPWTLLVSLVAWGFRAFALRRNARLKPKSTLQSATGIRSTSLKQISMGMMGGSFNTREFFHGASEASVRHVRFLLHALCFAVPALLLLGTLIGAHLYLLPLASVAQGVGLLAERWLFFAQANHPQNLYYQTVS